MGKIFRIFLTSYCFFMLILLTGCNQNSQDNKNTQPQVQSEDIAGKESAILRSQETSPGDKAKFTGVEWSREDEEKYAVYKGSLDICADRDNGGVYYVNWGYDKYLYYWKDGKTKLVLDKWVSQICYMDGMVYCIYDKTGKTYDPDVTPSYEGIICSVNVKTGEFNELAPVKAKRLAVCRDGIYYKWFTGPEVKERKDKGGFYSFGSQKISKIDDNNENGITQERYGKYATIYKDSGTYLKNLEDGSEQPFINEKYTELFIHICAGRCYYRVVNGDSKKSYIMDLKNGETHRTGSPIASQCLVQLNEDTDVLYTITGGGKITVYDPVKDKHKDVDIKNAYSSTHNNYIIEEIFSDGRYLYAIAGDGYDRTDIPGLVVLEADGEEISEIWSSMEYYDTKKKKQK
ncbi:MAG: hypothetical protein K1W24_04270 [Lachnospiraceae bacterium]